MSRTTGNGSTLTLGTQGGSYRFGSIGGLEESIEVLDDSGLDTTDFMEKCASDLKDIGEIEVPILFDSANGLPSIGAAPETITITLPQAQGQTAPATLAGTGFLSKRKFPDLQNGVLQEGSITIQFDGKTGPAFTPATTG